MSLPEQTALMEYYRQLSEMSESDARKKLTDIQSEEELQRLVSADAPIELVSLIASIEKMRGKIHKKILQTLSSLEKGRLNFVEGKLHQATRYFLQAIAQQDYRAHFELGMLFLSSAKKIRTQALNPMWKTHLEKAIELIPPDDDRKLDAFLILFAEAKNEKERAHYAHMAAKFGINEVSIIEAYSEIDDFKGVIERGEKAIQLGIQDPSIYHSMARAYANLGNWEEALQACDEGGKIGLPAVEKVKADILNTAHEFEEALPLARKAYEHKFPRANFTLITSLIGTKQWAEALELADYKKVEEKDLSQIFLARACIFAETGKKDVLLEEIKQQAEKTRIHYLIVALTTDLITIEEGIAIIKEYEQLSEAETFDFMANLLWEATLKQKALDCLEIALRQGIYTRVFRRMIQFLLEIDQLNDIEKISERAIKGGHAAFGYYGKAVIASAQEMENFYQDSLDSPAEAEAHALSYLDLGNLYTELREYQKAINAFNKAIDQGLNEAYIFLYKLLIKLNKKAEAKIIMQAGIAKGLEAELFIE